MKNQENIEYTYKHRKIVKYLAEKYIKKQKRKNKANRRTRHRQNIHVLNIRKKEVSRIHRKISKHHQNEKKKQK